MRFFLSLLFLTIMYSASHAHTLALFTENLEDGRILVTGRFSTGQSAAGAKVKLVSMNNKRVIFEKRLGNESELIVGIPDEPYEIILDGGPGHRVVKPGIEPDGGFKISYKETVGKETYLSVLNLAMAASIIIFISAFFAGFLSIMKIRNQNSDLS